MAVPAQPISSSFSARPEPRPAASRTRCAGCGELVGELREQPVEILQGLEADRPDPVAGDFHLLETGSSGLPHTVETPHPVVDRGRLRGVDEVASTT
jgi:hypothetical protein